MFPISPNQRNTWPSDKELTGTHILLADVSVEESIRAEWMRKGVLSVDCIDHHASAIAHWPTNADGSSTVIDTKQCASLQAWRIFFSMLPIPGWLQQIDRIDRWDNPTYEDRCLREYLYLIAHLPVQKKLDEAIRRTDEFFNLYNDPIQFQNLMLIGKQILDKKDADLFQLLQKGSVINIGPQHITTWHLPNHWLGRNIYLIDNTFIPFDTTEAAYIVFCHMPHVDAFVNFRRKVFLDKSIKMEKTIFVYSARSRGFDVTQGTIFKGHPTSAGASIILGESVVYPFVSIPPTVATTS